MQKKQYEILPEKHNDSLIAFLHKVIKFSVKILAILMVLVILLGVIDVIYVLYQHLANPPFMLLNLSDILKVFAAFLTVLIAIEIYQNIILYLRTDVIPLKLVVATALMAVARKIIIIDSEEATPMYILAIGGVFLALGITFFLLEKSYTKEDIIK